jgi:hypothetical protein
LSRAARPDGRVAMQWTANPRTAVRFRFRPPPLKTAFDSKRLFARKCPTGRHRSRKWDTLFGFRFAGRCAASWCRPRPHRVDAPVGATLAPLAGVRLVLASTTETHDAFPSVEISAFDLLTSRFRFACGSSGHPASGSPNTRAGSAMCWDTQAPSALRRSAAATRRRPRRPPEGAAVAGQGQSNDL